MNESKEITAKDLEEMSKEVNTKPGQPNLFGPGKLNMAVADLGHLSNCKGEEFYSMLDLNRWAEDHPSHLIYWIGPSQNGGLRIIYSFIDSDDTMEDKAVASAAFDKALQECRAKRAEKKAEQEKAAAEKAAADDACRVIGRLCIEKHGTFVTELPGLSVLKNVRKNIADDIIKLFEENMVGGENGHQEVLAGLEKILKKYVKDGVK